MSTDRDTTRIVRSWLEDGVIRLPDTVLDAVLDELPMTPQRRATWWPARRLLTMNTTLKFGFAAVIVAVAILIGINYLGTSKVGGPGIDESTPVPEPSHAAASSLLDSPNGGNLPPGEYYLDLEAYPGRIEFEVPEGWWYYWPDPTPREEADVHAILVDSSDTGAANGSAWGLSFAVVDAVRVDPCDAGAGIMDGSVTDSADALATAFSSWPDVPATSVEDVSIGGYSGTRVELDAGSSPCLARLFTTPAGYVFEIQRARAETPAPPEQFTFLDVEGSVLVIWTTDYPATNYWELDGGASFDPQAHAGDQVELHAILDSIVIEPRAAGSP